MYALQGFNEKQQTHKRVTAENQGQNLISKSRSTGRSVCYDREVSEVYPIRMLSREELGCASGL